MEYFTLVDDALNRKITQDGSLIPPRHEDFDEQLKGYCAGDEGQIGMFLVAQDEEQQKRRGED